MASKVEASTALFLIFNLLFFSLVSSTSNVDNPLDNGSSSNGVGGLPNDLSSGNSNNNAHGSSSTTNYPVVIPPGARLPQGQTATCNPLNLGVCLNLLGLVSLDVGNVRTQPCCRLIQGLADLEVALCLCTAVRANVLGINLNLPISLSLLLNNCGRRVATEYICGQ
ncbi:hypothetical protein REPUB_Repub03eG0263400 [Reevesia pubescens]